MHGFGREQRSVRFARFVEQIDYSVGLCVIQPNDRFAFQYLLRLTMSLHHELAEHAPSRSAAT